MWNPIAVFFYSSSRKRNEIANLLLGVPESVRHENKIIKASYLLGLKPLECTPGHNKGSASVHVRLMGMSDEFSWRGRV
jgi:hypothetical protein